MSETSPTEEKVDRYVVYRKKPMTLADLENFLNAAKSTGIPLTAVPRVQVTLGGRLKKVEVKT